MTGAHELARFVKNAGFEILSNQAVEQLRIRVLDALGCAIGALDGEPIQILKAQLRDFGDEGRCTIIGGGSAAPDRAALHNCGLIRYLDFNDSYLARGETCHPSDNLGAVLAAAEYASASGRSLMTALAIAYQVQCRLSDVAPVRAKGFDHTTQGSYAVAAGVSKALGMDVDHTANAIAICGTEFNALRVTRTGALSHWKGLAYPHMAFGCTNAVFLAMRGITGPLGVFEGNKGFMDAIAGPFEIDWAKEDLERVTRTIVKEYNAEIHSQSAIEGILDIKREYGISAEDVQNAIISIFDVAYHIIGGGEEGDKTRVVTKEQADHSLPYMIAVALIDGQVMPEQYAPDRILRNDVQSLLRRIKVEPSVDYSRRFPDEMPCRIALTLSDGRTLTRDKQNYEGFHTRPMKWDTVVKKFENLTSSRVPADLRRQLIEAVGRLESIQVSDLTALLRSVGKK
jgi:2-methylcitrate dehydratase